MDFRGEGPVQFQAQRGPMSLAADRDVNIASINGNITFGGPGNLFFKSSRSRKNSPRRCISPWHRSWLEPCHS